MFEKRMKHQLLIFASIGIIVFFALLNIDIPSLNVPHMTGAATKTNTPGTALVTYVSDFFEVLDVQFPSGSCGDIASGLYSSIAYKEVDSTVGFATTGDDRVATVNFVIDRINHYGTMDMANGNAVLAGDAAEGFIAFDAESIVRVPKETRSTYFFLELYGSVDEFFIVKRGKFSTPSVDCSFESRDGVAVCNCQTHRIYGIRTGGVTSGLTGQEAT